MFCSPVEGGSVVMTSLSGMFNNGLLSSTVGNRGGIISASSGYSASSNEEGTLDSSNLKFLMRSFSVAGAAGVGVSPHCINFGGGYDLLGCCAGVS